MKDDISKEIPPKAGRGLVLKGLRPEAYAESLVIIGKLFHKPLKIRPPAMNPTPHWRGRLEKIGMTGEIIPFSIKISNNIKLTFFNFTHSLYRNGCLIKIQS